MPELSDEDLDEAERYLNRLDRRAKFRKTSISRRTVSRSGHHNGSHNGPRGPGFADPDIQAKGHETRRKNREIDDDKTCEDILNILKILKENL